MAFPQLRYTIISTAVIISIFLLFQHHLVSSVAQTIMSKTFNFPSQRPIPQPYKPSMKTTTFGQLTALEDLSPAGDAAWAKSPTSAVTTAKGGFLWIKHNDTLQLPYGVTMFHALHCLGMVRKALQKNQGGAHAATHAAHAEHDDGPIRAESESHLENVHVAHCIAYIADTILCNSDTTIEPPWVKRDSAGNIIQWGVGGAGYQHQCRSTEYLWDILGATEQIQGGLEMRTPEEIKNGEEKGKWWRQGLKVEDVFVVREVGVQ